jgi:hypothetical protein
MNCQYLTPKEKFNLCELGLYGGKPSVGVCQRCIENGENNAGFAIELFKREESAHPEGVPKISGCCDRADQD